MSISIDTLKEAVQIKEQIASLEARLTKLMGGGGGEGPYPFLKSIKKGRRKMSAAARAWIGAAQRARWAKVKGSVVAVEKAVVKSVVSAEKAAVKSAKKAKRKLSAAGRAKIVAALKARWAKAKGTSAPFKPAKKKKGGITAEGRAKLAAAMKARWAARKKAGAPALNARKRK